MYDGAQEILAAISENERSAVHSLDLTVSKPKTQFNYLRSQLF